MVAFVFKRINFLSGEFDIDHSGPRSNWEWKPTVPQQNNKSEVQIQPGGSIVFRLHLPWRAVPGKSASDGQIPFFTSDELPHYADALLEVYGILETPLRQGKRGRHPLPRKCPPPDLCHAVVVKERERGRVVNVTTRIVYGSEQQVIAALEASPVSTTINTYGVKRNNLTIRQYSRRMGRKVNAFSKERDSVDEDLRL